MRLANQYSLFSENTTPILLTPLSLSIHLHIEMLMDMTHPHLTPSSTLKKTALIPFSSSQTKLLPHILLIPYNCQHHKFSNFAIRLFHVHKTYIESQTLLLLSCFGVKIWSTYPISNTKQPCPSLVSLLVPIFSPSSFILIHWDNHKTNPSSSKKLYYTISVQPIIL